MEAVTAVPIPPPSNVTAGPPTMSREASQTPGRDVMQSPTTATVPNGAHVGVDNTNGSGTPSAATAIPASVSRPPSTQPSPMPGPMQPPAQQTQPPSSQPPPQPQPQPQPQATPAALNGQKAYSPSSQSHQNHQGTRPARVPPTPEQIRERHAALRRFPSPDRDHAFHMPPFNRDLTILADAVQQACPEAVRRIVRDKWEKCVMGSEFHHAFLLNAVMHHASGTIMRRAIRDFGRNMVSEARHEIVAHIKPQDLDDIAPAILEKCSDKFLDQALEQRLKTIGARSLISALARAERLGFDSNDIAEDQPERVVPAAPMYSPGLTQAGLSHMMQPQHPPAAPVTVPVAVPPQQHMQPPQQAHRVQQVQHAQHAPAAADLTCKLCWRTFRHTKPYEFHVQKQLCTKSPAGSCPFWCEECGAGFTTKGGQQYHTANGVCGLHSMAVATPRSQDPPPVSEMPTSTRLAYHSPPTSSQPYSTPIQPRTTPMETPSSIQDDPYKHLTPVRRAQLEEELRQAEMSYGPRFKEAKEMADPMARQSKLESLQNTFSTKQSIIRKKYGVRLRHRRTRAEIEGEKSRMGMKHAPSSPVSQAETPSAKRQKTNGTLGSPGRPSYISHGPQTQTPIPPPTNHLSVSEMNNSGLGGSTATAATKDPTAIATPSQLPPKEQSPPNSLSSLQRKGYRVSSHVGHASRPASNSPIERQGSASTPVVLDDDSSDTETDDDIPATVPPKKSV
ncbi:hypothetical protein F5Y01DRAFT_3435 [Xylaria sp. FL0043]|nr:hypothetical protein F5Y01DRAFT_3435 [Xylaria sp. FL0043]